MEGEKIEQHSLRNQKLKKLGPVAMEIASKGAKIRYVFSHFLRRALPPVHIAIHRCATRGISCLTWMAWIRHTHAYFWQVQMQDFIRN